MTVQDSWNREKAIQMFQESFFSSCFNDGKDIIYISFEKDTSILIVRDFDIQDMNLSGIHLFRMLTIQDFATQDFITQTFVIQDCDIHQLTRNLAGACFYRRVLLRQQERAPVETKRTLCGSAVKESWL
ncbi:hypothetical protein M513_12520 [Trichuris suis]|uniref:Uncharacterized protein n=1 Tax=Trichuris suis TaxID=68888 RepID=A0A085LNP0_9BILA|nr:hypothetical protein M513_12520 [Trichuris suis]